ncbi:MAG: hypothetical protein LCH53_04470 [Bacteroidetes bacterium]|nr:hypothetical protein [Bacteroidota bacterium]
MATKKKRSTGSKGGAKNKPRASKAQNRRPAKRVSTQKSVTYYKNPAPSAAVDIAKQTASVLVGEVVSGIAAGKVTQMLPASMSPKMRALAGVGVSGALAALGLKKGKNRLVQMAAVGAAVQTGKTIIKTFAPQVPGLGDAASLSDGMDLGAVAYGATYQQTSYSLDPYAAPQLTPYIAAEVLPAASSPNDLPAELKYGGVEIGGLDYQQVR